MASTEVFNISSSSNDDTFGENSQYLELSENINKMFKTLNLDDSNEDNVVNGGVDFSGDSGNAGGGSSLSSNISTSSASSSSSSSSGSSSGGNNGNGGMNNNNEKLLTNGMNSMNVDTGNVGALSSNIGNSNNNNNDNVNANGGSMSLGETNLNNALKGPLESSSDSSSDGIERDCKICKNTLQMPRVLSCLHVFCESCLEKLLKVDKVDYEFTDGCGSICCPVCDQLTKIGNKGLESLHCDYIITNILDLSAVEPGTLACTSCVSKEKALSRCNDCAHFLCSSCVNAHKYMRCFENHEVVLLDELRKSKEKVTIHKPLFCQNHPTENLKYYCFNCQVPVCNDCLIADHKGTDHHYELINTAEKRIRTEILNTIESAKNKIKNYDEMGNTLGNALNEIQTQHDVAQEMIEKTFENFKKAVEKRYEQSIANLEKIHSERELRIMDFIHKIEKCIDKIDGACTFTERVLNKSNGSELLSLSRLIRRQFLLFHNTPKFECNFSLVFKSNFDKFEEIAEDLFGKIQTESTLTPKESTPPPTLPGMLPIMVKSGNVTGNFGNNNNSNHSQGALTNSVTASSPISLPTSMQSSFDGDISALTTNYILPNVLTPDTSSHSNQLNNVIVGSGGISAGGGGVQTSSNCGGPAVGGQSSVNAVGGGNSFGVGGVSDNASVGGTNNIPVLSSIAEYNLHCLANLADATDMTNAMVAVASSNASPTQTPQFTLADIISGDQRAFNNLKALAKIGMQNNTLNGMVGDLSDNSILARVSSPNIDSVASMLNVNEFVGLSSASGGIGSIGSNSSSDVLGLNFPRTNSAAGRSKASAMQIRCKFGSLGASKGQFNAPHGFCLGVEEEIIVADTSNHRIEVFEKNGSFKFQFGVPGKEEGQLWYPRKVAVMRTNHKFVVCDRGNERSRMQLFTKNGHFIKKIAIRYIDIVAGLAVTNQGLIVAVDSVSPTVFIINEEGDLVHWFDCSDHMREPSDIAILGNDFYICDFKGHCVAVFKDTGTFLYRIGHEKVTCFPNGIDISDAGDILIGDSHGNRFHVACFSRDGTLQSEYECPYVKVSRCCGLKITSEGYVVTLAKNNHHVLVLNTLYVQ